MPCLTDGRVRNVLRILHSVVNINIAMGLAGSTNVLLTAALASLARCLDYTQILVITLA
jgi:hypothetical protein